MHREYKDKMGWMHYIQSGPSENIKVFTTDGHSIEASIWEESVTTGKQRVPKGVRTLVQFEEKTHASAVSDSEYRALKDLAQQLGKDGYHLHVWGVDAGFYQTGLSEGSGYGYVDLPNGKTTPAVRGIAARLSVEELEAAEAKKAAELEDIAWARKDREIRLRNELLLLARYLSKPRLHRDSEFGGAGILFTDQPREAQTSTFYSPPRYVITTHFREVSWFIIGLRDIFYAEKMVNFFSKFEFFGRLGNAANRCLEENPGTGAHGLCAAVMHEAFAISEEMQVGNFHALSFAIDRGILDDHADPLLRKGFISQEDTQGFFRNLGIEIIQDC